MITQNLLDSDLYYKPNDIRKILNLIKGSKLYKKDKVSYYNIACAFDIETTSFYSPDDRTEKKATMYEWTLGLDGYIIVGRDWMTLLDTFETMTDVLELGKDKRLVLYVHNLSFEFQWIRHWLEWDKVFSLENRKVIYAKSTMGIDFRCSYLLSGYSLAKLGDELNYFKVKKKVGDLDYKLYRHSLTPLTDAEIGYCLNDVKVVMAYVQERMMQDGNITKLQLTKTGYVRDYCRNACFFTGTNHHSGGQKYNRYKSLMRSLTVDAEEYEQLKRAFQGGFTHANAVYAEKVMTNVRSYDFTSSYPSVMIAEKFPMSRSRLVQINSKEQFYYLLDKYCCLFDIEFTNIEPKVYFENPISLSKCSEVTGYTDNNGRVVRADKLVTTITEQDFFTIEEFYEWESVSVFNFRIYDKAYLPTDFVEAILKLYSDKTTLKGVEGKEVEYLASKEMLNACYGMIVTDICREEISYDGEWKSVRPDLEKSINAYNNNYRRFLFYPWGVWVTAYARRNLFTGIMECGYDYVYSDTDSIKCINSNDHLGYFERYNQEVEEKLHRAMIHHELDDSCYKPLTIKGEEKILGVWDDEGVYDRFKTLGAKRYMVEKNGKVNITVSGLNKKVTVPYLLEKYDDVFDAFSDKLYIPPEYTGKNTHTYIDDEMYGEITDYLGNKYVYHEYSGVHLEESEYSLSLSVNYLNYLMGIRELQY